MSKDLETEVQSLKDILLKLERRSDAQETLMSQLMGSICDMIPNSMLTTEIRTQINSVRALYNLAPLEIPEEEPLDGPNNASDEGFGPDNANDEGFDVPRMLVRTLYPHFRYAMVNILCDCDPALNRIELYRLPEEQLQEMYDRIINNPIL